MRPDGFLAQAVRKYAHNTQVALDHDAERISILEDVVQLLHDVLMAGDQETLAPRDLTVHSQLVLALYFYCSGTQHIFAGQFYPIQALTRLALECLLYGMRIRDSEEAFAAWYGRHNEYVAAVARAGEGGGVTFEDFFTLDRDNWQAAHRQFYRAKLRESAEAVLRRLPQSELVIDALFKQYDEAIAYGAHPNVMLFIEESTTGHDGKSALSMFARSGTKYRHHLVTHATLGQLLATCFLAMWPERALGVGVAERMQLIDLARRRFGI